MSEHSPCGAGFVGENHLDAVVEDGFPRVVPHETIKGIGQCFSGFVINGGHFKFTLFFQVRGHFSH